MNFDEDIHKLTFPPTELDIKETVDILENKTLQKGRYVKTISLVQFLRDRELGIRGTNKRSRQGVDIKKCESVDDCSEIYPKLKPKLYKDIFDWCKKKKLDECARNDVPYDIESKDEIHYYSREVTEQIRRLHSSGAIIITIPAGFGRYVKLFIVQNGRKEFWSLRVWSHDAYKKMFKARITMQDKFYHVYADYADIINSKYDKSLIFNYELFLNMHYYVQDIIRCCSLCTHKDYSKSTTCHKLQD